jgi:asparagine synthase (glutamine-hydrolysing)
MCGIAGFTWPDSDLIARMTSAVAHRGPDDAGRYVAQGVSLGHRRLSIIDLSADGRQPLCNEDGSIWLVFNGEIYNFQELRETLEAAGHVFRSRSDSEVIVHAYEEYGRGCLDRLHGMFALAIWDEKVRTLLLARDRVGIKPLYYARTPEGLIFASEIKALLCCDALPRQTNLQAVYSFLGYEFVPEPETMFEGIMKLQPGTWLSFREGGVETGSYWDLNIEAVDRTNTEHESVLRDAMREAVRSHLVSDVPLGVFLSGGLDSSAVVAFMSRSGVERIRTFSLGYADRSFSELEYARLVSRAFNTEHQELIIDPVTPEVIEQVVWHLDEPMSDLANVPFYLLCKEVRQHVTACLSGEGGDETLAGYDRFKASKANRYYSVLPSWVRRKLIAPLILRLSDRPQKKGAINLLKRFVEGGLLPEDGEHMRWQYFGTPALEDRLFRAPFRERIRADPFAPVRHHLTGKRFRTALDRELYLETRFALVSSPLFKVDRMSMAHGLEVRVPLLDHRFIEACATIPGDLKLRGFTTKAIFRTALRGILPDEILNRGKQGYSLPIKNWLRGELREFMFDTIESSMIIRELFDLRYIHQLIDEHQTYRANHNHVLWALLNLAVWHRLFMESPRSESTREQNAGRRVQHREDYGRGASHVAIR